MIYKILITPAAERQFRKLSERVQKKIRDVILSLAEGPQPDGCKKLHAKKKLWSIRVSNYRVIYQIESKELIVLVVKIGDRREIYQKLDKIEF